MQIWVDGDACPGEVKALLFKTPVNRKVPVTVVANQSIHTPKSQYIATVLVPSGMNIADRKIVVSEQQRIRIQVLRTFRRGQSP